MNQSCEKTVIKLINTSKKRLLDPCARSFQIEIGAMEKVKQDGGTEKDPGWETVADGVIQEGSPRRQWPQLTRSERWEVLEL